MWRNLPDDNLLGEATEIQQKVDMENKVSRRMTKAGGSRGLRDIDNGGEPCVSGSDLGLQSDCVVLLAPCHVKQRLTVHG